MVWAFLNTPDNFDGSTARRMMRLADELSELGAYRQADDLRRLARKVAPLTGWYGEGGNQASHILIGVVSTILFINAWFLVSGEMPVRSWAFTMLFLGYAVIIEAMVQRWRPGDSWFDSVMFGLGCMGALVPFVEIEPMGLTVAVEYRPLWMTAIIATAAALLGARVWTRVRDAKEYQ